MACKRVRIRGHLRCRCGSKFVKNSRCGLKTSKSRKRPKRRRAGPKSRRSMVGGRCIGKPFKKRMGRAGMRCACKTGGRRIKLVKSAKCGIKKKR